MSTPAERITVSRRIAAPAAKIFSFIIDPDMHVAIDGSGMLLASPDSEPVAAVGDKFLMNMDREPLGDIPMGKYQVQNTVTRFEQDRLLEWTIGGVDQEPFGHLYGYTLTPVSADETDVELYCDWTNFSPALKERVTWPVVPAHMLENSLGNLDSLARR